jgi:hypothetical protein
MKKIIYILALTTVGMVQAQKQISTIYGEKINVTNTADDRNTNLATTNFVNNTVGAVLNKSVAGSANINLTTLEASNAVIVLTGAITAAIDVTVPTTSIRPFTVVNNTTGAFNVTFKTLGGNGVLITQGKSNIVYNDGTNVGLTQNDFTLNGYGGFLNKTGLTGGTVALTSTEALSDIIRLNGTLTSNLIVTIPASIIKRWTVKNNTTGSFSVRIKTPAGAAVYLAPGKPAEILGDGTNIEYAAPYPISGNVIIGGNSGTPRTSIAGTGTPYEFTISTPNDSGDLTSKSVYMNSYDLNGGYYTTYDVQRISESFDAGNNRTQYRILVKRIDGTSYTDAGWGSTSLGISYLIY